MRFLCLHGAGTNSRIFKGQTSAIRHELGSNHTYEWIDGSIPTTKAEGLDILNDTKEEYLAYIDPPSPESCIQAIDDFEQLVEDEGPFDAVMAYSQGAYVAAAAWIRRMQQNPQQERKEPLFRCAIFFSGAVPEDTTALPKSRRLMSVEQDGEVIEAPTAHIWGRSDKLQPTFGPVLSKLCKASQREEFVHEGGHEIPGPRDQEAIAGIVRAINRTLTRACVSSTP